MKDKVDQNPNTKKMKIDLHALIDEIAKINELGDIDSDMAVVKARKIIETIITDLTERAGVKKPNLKETIDFLYYKRTLIPPEIFSLLSTIRVFGNLGGHFELGNSRKISRKNVKLIGDMTANIVEWYITSEI